MLTVKRTSNTKLLKGRRPYVTGRWSDVFFSRSTKDYPSHRLTSNVTMSSLMLCCARSAKHNRTL